MKGKLPCIYVCPSLVITHSFHGTEILPIFTHLPLVFVQRSKSSLQLVLTTEEGCTHYSLVSMVLLLVTLVLQLAPSSHQQ